MDTPNFSPGLKARARAIFGDKDRLADNLEGKPMEPDDPHVLVERALGEVVGGGYAHTVARCFQPRLEERGDVTVILPDVCFGGLGSRITELEKGARTDFENEVERVLDQYGPVHTFLAGELVKVDGVWYLLEEALAISKSFKEALDALAITTA
jgi:hypothetical protein